MIGRALLLLTILGIGFASACTCIREDPDVHVQNAENILRVEIGSVLTTTSTTKYYWAKVSEIYKANRTALSCGQQILVRTTTSSCAAFFEKGSYLVFGRTTSIGIGSLRGPVVLETSMCDHNQLFCSAINDNTWKPIIDKLQGKCGCVHIDIYAPVCGKCDHLHVKTFSNSGAAGCAGYSVLDDGECLPVYGRDCPAPSSSDSQTTACQHACNLVSVLCEMGQPRCCSNGKWSCPVGDASDPSTWAYTCENDTYCETPTVSDCQGKCKDAVMTCFWGTPRCCANGQLSCPSGNVTDESTWTYPGCVDGFCPDPVPGPKRLPPEYQGSTDNSVAAASTDHASASAAATVAAGY